MGQGVFLQGGGEGLLEGSRRLHVVQKFELLPKNRQSSRRGVNVFWVVDTLHDCGIDTAVCMEL